MDTTAFKQRMQSLKSYRENNPDKGYWDWKADAFQDGGSNDNLVGSYSNHTGTPTMYVPVTKEYEATPDGFGEIANVHTPEVVITPQNNISLAEAVDKGRRDAAPYVGAIVAGAALPAISSTGGLGTAMDLAGVITDPLDPLNYIDKLNLRRFKNLRKLSRELNAKQDDKRITEFINNKLFRDFATFGKDDSKFVHTQSGQAYSIFSGKHLGAYTKDNKLYPGAARSNDQKPYIWWNKNKPYTDLGVNSDGFTVTVIRPEDASDLTKVRDMKVPVGQWNGEQGFVMQSEYVTNNPVPLKNAEQIRFNGLTNTYEKIKYYADGGKTGDPDMEKFYQATGRSRSGRPLEEGLEPAVTLEDILSFTPLGDIAAATDAIDAISQKDWAGVGMAALGVLPFVPNLYRSIGSKVRREIPTVKRTFQEKVNANDLARERERKNRNKITEEYIDQRNRTYELMNTPEARRRTTEIDRKYGTDYNKVYDELTDEYEDIKQYVNLPDPNFVPNKKDFATINPSESKRINLSTDNIKTVQDYPQGLIRHELGHYVDEKAYPGGIKENAYLKQLGKPSKYVPLSEFENGFSDKSEAKRLYEYFMKPTEKKSIMNQFDEYLMNTYTPLTYPSNTKQFRNAIESAPDEFLNMKYLLRMHKKPGILYKDFLNRPLVNNQNKTKNKETQIV